MLERYEGIEHQLDNLQKRVRYAATHYHISDLSYLKNMTKAQLFTFFLSQAFFALDYMVESLRKELIEDTRGWGQAQFLQDQKIPNRLAHVFPDADYGQAWSYFAREGSTDVYAVFQHFLGTFATTDRTIVLGEVLKKEGDMDILEEYHTQLRSLSMLYAEHFFKEFFPGEPADKLAASHILLHRADDLWEEWMSVVSYMYFLIHGELWKPEIGKDCLMFRLEDYFGSTSFDPFPIYWLCRSPDSFDLWAEEHRMAEKEREGNMGHLMYHLTEEMHEDCGSPAVLEAVLYFSDIKAFRWEGHSFSEVFFRRPGLDLVANMIHRAKNLWKDG